MADRLSPLDALEQKELEANQARRKAIDAAMKEVREAEMLLSDAKQKVQSLQQAQLKADYDYDTARRRLIEAEESAKDKAA